MFEHVKLSFAFGRELLPERGELLRARLRVFKPFGVVLIGELLGSADFGCQLVGAVRNAASVAFPGRDRGRATRAGFVFRGESAEVLVLAPVGGHDARRNTRLSAALRIAVFVEF